MKNRILSSIAAIIFVGFGFLFGFLFFNCIKEYKEYDIGYNDLKCETLTFDRYEQIIRSKGGDIYEIYFEEYDIPFEIDNITQKELNKKGLNKITKGDSLKVFYRESDSKKYDYEICQLLDDNIVYLDFKDYISVNRTNQVIGMIVCPILVLFSVFLVSFFIWMTIKIY